MGNNHSKGHNNGEAYNHISSSISDYSKIEHPDRYIPPFAAVWHKIIPETREYPINRTGHFYSYYPAKDCAITGCGSTSDHALLNDFWSLNLKNYTWTRLNITGTLITPRSGAKSTIVDDTLYIFGGYSDPIYYNDLYAVNLNTLFCTKIEGTGEIPTPRKTPLFSNFKHKLYIWGGFDGSWPSDLYVFDLVTQIWSKYNQSAPGRSGETYETIGNSIYCYMSAKMGGMYVVNMETNEVKQVQTSGREPDDPNLLNSGLVKVDHYLFLIGGKSTNKEEYTLLYACDVYKMKWFLFYLIPDDDSVNLCDGYINEEYNFMVPRTASMGIVYSTSSRKIFTFLGRPMTEDPPPIHVFDLGDAYSIIHLEHDMLEMCKPEVPVNNVLRK